MSDDDFRSLFNAKRNAAIRKTMYGERDAALTRELMKEELDAQNSYGAKAEASSDSHAKDVYEDIAEEEAVHTGELAEVLSHQDPDAKKNMKEGVEEAKSTSEKKSATSVKKRKIEGAAGTGGRNFSFKPARTGDDEDLRDLKPTSDGSSHTPGKKGNIGNIDVRSNVAVRPYSHKTKGEKKDVLKEYEEEGEKYKKRSKKASAKISKAMPNEAFQRVQPIKTKRDDFSAVDLEKLSEFIQKVKDGEFQGAPLPFIPVAAYSSHFAPEDSKKVSVDEEGYAIVIDKDGNKHKKRPAGSLFKGVTCKDMMNDGKFYMPRYAKVVKSEDGGERIRLYLRPPRHGMINGEKVSRESAGLGGRYTGKYENKKIKGTYTGEQKDYTTVRNVRESGMYVDLTVDDFCKALHLTQGNDAKEYDGVSRGRIKVDDKGIVYIRHDLPNGTYEYNPVENGGINYCSCVYAKDMWVLRKYYPNIDRLQNAILMYSMEKYAAKEGIDSTAIPYDVFFNLARKASFMATAYYFDPSNPACMQNVVGDEYLKMISADKQTLERYVEAHAKARKLVYKMADSDLLVNNWREQRDYSSGNMIDSVKIIGQGERVPISSLVRMVNFEERADEYKLRKKRELKIDEYRKKLQESLEKPKALAEEAKSKIDDMKQNGFVYGEADGNAKKEFMAYKNTVDKYTAEYNAANAELNRYNRALLKKDLKVIYDNRENAKKLKEKHEMFKKLEEAKKGEGGVMGGVSYGNSYIPIDVVDFYIRDELTKKWIDYFKEQGYEFNKDGSPYVEEIYDADTEDVKYIVRKGGMEEELSDYKIHYLNDLFINDSMASLNGAIANDNYFDFVEIYAKENEFVDSAIQVCLHDPNFIAAMNAAGADSSEMFRLATAAVYNSYYTQTPEDRMSILKGETILPTFEKFNVVGDTTDEGGVSYEFPTADVAIGMAKKNGWDSVSRMIDPDKIELYRAAQNLQDTRDLRKEWGEKYETMVRAPIRWMTNQMDLKGKELQKVSDFISKFYSGGLMDKNGNFDQNFLNEYFGAPDGLNDKGGDRRMYKGGVPKAFESAYKKMKNATILIRKVNDYIDLGSGYETASEDQVELHKDAVPYVIDAFKRYFMGQKLPELKADKKAKELFDRLKEKQNTPDPNNENVALEAYGIIYNAYIDDARKGGKNNLKGDAYALVTNMASRAVGGKVGIDEKTGHPAVISESASDYGKFLENLDNLKDLLGEHKFWNVDKIMKEMDKNIGSGVNKEGIDQFTVVQDFDKSKELLGRLKEEMRKILNEVQRDTWTSLEKNIPTEGNTQLLLTQLMAMPILKEGLIRAEEEFNKVSKQLEEEWAGTARILSAQEDSAYKTLYVGFGDKKEDPDNYVPSVIENYKAHLKEVMQSNPDNKTITEEYNRATRAEKKFKDRQKEMDAAVIDSIKNGTTSQFILDPNIPLDLKMHALKMREFVSAGVTFEPPENKQEDVEYELDLLTDKPTGFPIMKDICHPNNRELQKKLGISEEDANAYLVDGSAYAVRAGYRIWKSMNEYNKTLDNKNSMELVPIFGNYLSKYSYTIGDELLYDTLNSDILQNVFDSFMDFHENERLHVGDEGQFSNYLNAIAGFDFGGSAGYLAQSYDSVSGLMNYMASSGVKSIFDLLPGDLWIYEKYNNLKVDENTTVDDITPWTEFSQSDSMLGKYLDRFYEDPMGAFEEAPDDIKWLMAGSMHPGLDPETIINELIRTDEGKKAIDEDGDLDIIKFVKMLDDKNLLNDTNVTRFLVKSTRDYGGEKALNYIIKDLSNNGKMSWLMSDIDENGTSLVSDEYLMDAAKGFINSNIENSISRIPSADDGTIMSMPEEKYSAINREDHKAQARPGEEGEYYRSRQFNDALRTAKKEAENEVIRNHGNEYSKQLKELGDEWDRSIAGTEIYNPNSGGSREDFENEKNENKKLYILKNIESKILQEHAKEVNDLVKAKMQDYVSKDDKALLNKLNNYDPAVENEDNTSAKNFLDNLRTYISTNPLEDRAKREGIYDKYVPMSLRNKIFSEQENAGDAADGRKKKVNGRYVSARSPYEKPSPVEIGEQLRQKQEAEDKQGVPSENDRRRMEIYQANKAGDPELNEKLWNISRNSAKGNPEFNYSDLLNNINAGRKEYVPLGGNEDPSKQIDEMKNRVKQYNKFAFQTFGLPSRLSKIENIIKQIPLDDKEDVENAAQKYAKVRVAYRHIGRGFGISTQTWNDARGQPIFNRDVLRTIRNAINSKAQELGMGDRYTNNFNGYGGKVPKVTPAKQEDVPEETRQGQAYAERSGREIPEKPKDKTKTPQTPEVPTEIPKGYDEESPIPELISEEINEENPTVDDEDADLVLEDIDDTTHKQASASDDEFSMESIMESFKKKREDVLDKINGRRRL